MATKPKKLPAKSRKKGANKDNYAQHLKRASEGRAKAKGKAASASALVAVLLADDGLSDEARKRIRAAHAAGGVTRADLAALIQYEFELVARYAKDGQLDGKAHVVALNKIATQLGVQLSLEQQQHVPPAISLTFQLPAGALPPGTVSAPDAPGRLVDHGEEIPVS